MKILFVHQNFPGQFPHLAPALAARGHQVLALTDMKNQRSSPVPVVKYKTPEPVTCSQPMALGYAEHVERGFMAARGARALRDRHGYTPDLIFGHSGWGEMLFLREIWPDAKTLVYAELLYRTRGHDVDFDPEVIRDVDFVRFNAIARSAHLAMGVMHCDAAIAPTRYQQESFPPELRSKITVIHDGIDTAEMRPDPDAVLELPDGQTLTARDEVVTYVSRSLEAYRGFHIFMRALPAVLRARPKAQVVIIGKEESSYGAAPEGFKSWKAKMLAELDGQIDLSRVHFLGLVDRPRFRAALQISRVHCYLTYPFVLSWSLTEAMSAGAYIVASDTAPVREVITDGVHGRLVPFFDVEAVAAALIRGLEGDPDAALLRDAARRRIMAEYDLRSRCLPRLIEWVESHAPDRAGPEDDGAETRDENEGNEDDGQEE